MAAVMRGTICFFSIVALNMLGEMPVMMRLGKHLFLHGMNRLFSQNYHRIHQHEHGQYQGRDSSSCG